LPLKRVSEERGIPSTSQRERIEAKKGFRKKKGRPLLSSKEWREGRVSRGNFYGERKEEKKGRKRERKKRN